jgi:hypothetical protein
LDHAEGIVQKVVKRVVVTKVERVAIIKTRQTNRQGMILAVVLVQQMPRVVQRTTSLSKSTSLDHNTITF